jgi:hypothetical protein
MLYAARRERDLPNGEPRGGSGRRNGILRAVAPSAFFYSPPRPSASELAWTQSL